MSEKLRDYQVLDILCGGTLYKVRHKVNNKTFAWRAFDCSALGPQRTKLIVSDVSAVSQLRGDCLLHYHDTILHAPSKTLYFVLEYNCWSSAEDFISLCRESDKFVAESFVWYLLYELAKVSKLLEGLRLKALRKSISSRTVFLDESGALKVNCFDLTSESAAKEDLIRDIGHVVHTFCFYNDSEENKFKEYCYSEDLHDVINFLKDERNSHLKPDIVLYHPTVLANLEISGGSKRLCDVLLSASHLNKCDSEKAVELHRSFLSASSVSSSPTYANITLRKTIYEVEDVKPQPGCLSPTIAALALELPGFVPRSRQPITDATDSYKSPQKVSERTLSHQWMSRLVALRQREESLNKRERDLISKEIVNSPCVKKSITFNEAEDVGGSDGITLPAFIPTCKEDRSQWVSRRRHRSSSVRLRRQRKSLGYEDIDSSLSADPGDSSMIVTATKFTKDNLPRRNIFPEVSTKKVHFTPSNPFVESDESVTLTFYELENVDLDRYQMPKKVDQKLGDISKFKYMDLEKATTEKRSAMQQWNHSSPSKLAKTTPLVDITNHGNIRKTPSKSSLLSKASISSGSTKCSITSGSIGSDCQRTRSSVRCSLAPQVPQTEVKPKPKGRKSLLNFKTPFKFMTSSKV